MKQHPQHHLGLRLYDYQTNRRRARNRHHRLLYLAGALAIISLIAASRV